MKKFLLVLLHSCILLFLCLSCVSISAQHTPVAVTGYNQDVVAEGTGTSSLATTTREMDAITPSNFVMCTKQFATANAFTPANIYGLPDNGLISTTASPIKNYQMAAFTGSNVVYMFPGDTGRLKITTPARYTNISLLVMATEGDATVVVTFKFTDGTTQIFNNQTFFDWFSATTTGIAIHGFGRIKRKAGPFVAAADYEGGNLINPHLYSLEFALPCAKTLDSVIFRNISTLAFPQSRRAFVLGVSGVAGNVPATPLVNPVTLCSAGTATLTVQNAAAGVNYTWYAAPTGGFASSTGSTFTTPSLSANTTYYVIATNALSGCVSDPRTPVTVTVSAPPAAPTANPVSVCPNNTAILTVTNPQANVTYNWYTAATGGTIAATGTSFTTPLITASTTYYVEAVNTAGCTSTTRTPVAVTFLPKLPAPVAQATTIGANAITFTWTAVAGATGYQVSVNNGALQTPSSGATGLTHTATGLQPLSNITFKVIALGPQSCQNSDTTTVIARTLTDEIYIPNSFTPNGDGRNDIFRAYGNIITGIDMNIFNQWGQKILQSTDLTSGWNGTYKGKQQPVGVYVYVMKLSLSNGTSILRKGEINLVR